MGEPARDLAGVRERPILLSSPMIRAILDGRKTQTRRAVSPRGWNPNRMTLSKVVHHSESRIGTQAYFGDDNWGAPCPFGSPGERLWVRETWAAHPLDESEPPARILFAADGANYDFDVVGNARRGPRNLDRVDETGEWVVERWRPSIHMPRWACRLTLEITSARVERLQDISDADIEAEGTSAWVEAGGVVYTPVAGFDGAQLNDDGKTITVKPNRVCFASLWDSVSPANLRWRSNPWVWVVSFKRLEGKHG